MKCEICKRRCKWDNSFGKENYIVCNDCMNTVSEYLVNTLKVDVEPYILRTIPLTIFFKLSDIREENKK